MKKQIFKYKDCSDSEGIILTEQDVLRFFEYMNYEKYDCKDSKVYIEKALDNSFVQWVFMSQWGVDQGELTYGEFEEIIELFKD